MPGIVGIITKDPREEARFMLPRMVEILCHRSDYVTGTWIDESLGVYVGWAERKASFCEGMPLRNEQDDIVLIFSGEEFPPPGTVAGLKERGHSLADDEASYLVHFYEEDPSFIAKLNGWFHGLLVDQKRGTTLLFNDRYGMRRIYYHETKSALYFAAEAKAILAVRPELRTLDPRGLGEFISCGCVMENRSLFEGIHVLPAASAWSFRNGTIDKKSSYFDPQEWEQQEPLEPEACYKELRNVFARNLPRYFNGKQQIAMSLTGGLDTRMIMAWQNPAPGSLPCYSFGGAFRDSQDIVQGRKVAYACGQPYRVIVVGEQFLSNFANYAEQTVYLSDGCVSVNFSPDLYAHQVASKIAPVRMTGSYGGEVLRGVPGIKALSPAPGLFSPEIVPQIQFASDACSHLLRSRPLSLAVFSLIPWYHCALVALQQTQLTIRSPYLDNDLVKTAYRAPSSTLSDHGFSLRLIKEANAALAKIRTDRGLAADQKALPAAVSRNLLEFTFKAEYAWDYGMPHWMAKIDHLLAPLHVERLFLGRHKFAHFRAWYRDRLSDYVQEILLDSSALSRPYLNSRKLRDIVQHHIKGDRNYTSEIHKLLTLELVNRLFIDSRVATRTCRVLACTT